MESGEYHNLSSAESVIGTEAETAKEATGQVVRLYQTYNFSRQDIIEAIKNNSQIFKAKNQLFSTTVYWLGEFRQQFLQMIYAARYEIGFSDRTISFDDDWFLISRNRFDNRLFFTQRDFNFFLAPFNSKMRALESEIESIHRTFYLTNRNIFRLNLNDFVPEGGFTIKRLIEMFLIFRTEGLKEL